MVNHSRASHPSGFTLIELLVVIAIIALLSSIVVGALTVARSKGNDSNIEQSLSHLRSQAGIDFSTYGIYSPNGTPPGVVFGPVACPTSASSTGLFADTIVINMLNASTNNGSWASSCREDSPGARYAISVQLNADPTKAFCIDYLGTAKIEILPGTGTIQSQLNSLTGGYTCS